MQFLEHGRFSINIWRMNDKDASRKVFLPRFWAPGTDFLPVAFLLDSPLIPVSRNWRYCCCSARLGLGSFLCAASPGPLDLHIALGWVCSASTPGTGPRDTATQSGWPLAVHALWGDPFTSAWFSDVHVITLAFQQASEPAGPPLSPWLHAVRGCQGNSRCYHPREPYGVQKAGSPPKAWLLLSPQPFRPQRSSSHMLLSSQTETHPAEWMLERCRNKAI